MTTTTLKEWEMKLYHGLPVILGFAIIGMIVFLGGIVYFTYRNFRNTRRREAEKDKEQEEGSAVPYLAITSPPPAKGFVPIHTSLHLVPREEILNDPARRHGVDEVKLWEQRQQEKPFWKFMTDYPDSPESIKTEIEQPMNRSVSEIIHPISIPRQSVTCSGDILLVRQALQDSKVKNSSSQWLHFSGSKSF